MLINGIDMNMTQVSQYPTSPPSQQSDENVLAAALIYLFAHTI
jgi:hypothetical protein